MADYLSGTTTKLFFAGLEVGEVTGFTKEPTITWSENDFMGTPVKQFIPIKIDATGSIDRLIPDWQMFALALGYTYYNTTDDIESFQSGDANPDILWRKIEYFDLPYNDTSPMSIDTGALPVEVARFIGRMPELEHVKLRMRDGGGITGILTFQIIGSVSGVIASVNYDTAGLTGSFAWITLAPTTSDVVLEEECTISLVGTTGSGTLDVSKSLKYSATPNIRGAFVAGFKSNAFDEGFEIRVYHAGLEGELKYIEKFTGVIFHRSGIEIAPNELTSSSLEWYASGYLIYKT